MIIANAHQIERFIGKTAYASGIMHESSSAKVNAATVAATNGKLPCYAIKGKRTAFKWVSVRSSAVISRGVAKEWLSRYGVDIDLVELA